MLILNACDGAMVSFLDAANTMSMDLPNVDSTRMEALQMVTDDMNEEISFPHMPMPGSPPLFDTLSNVESESSSLTNEYRTSQNDVI